MEILIKNYRKWMGKKSTINNYRIVRSFREGDIWWAAVGENVGVEIDGKNEDYSRPVVILKKHSNLFFTAIPLTSKLHGGSWYIPFEFQKRPEIAVIVQSRTMDASRLYRRMGKLSKRDYDRILNAYLALFRNKNTPE